MINGFIWDLLSKDEIDESQSNFFTELKTRFWNLENIDQLQHWKSLKTLLGDSSTNWAVNKIHIRQEKDVNLQINHRDLPKIFISQAGGFALQSQSHNRFSGTIQLSINTPVKSSDFLVRTLYRRIKRVLFTDLSTGSSLGSVITQDISNGITNLELRLESVQFFAETANIMIDCNYTEF